MFSKFSVYRRVEGELVEELVKYGLTPIQACVYVALIKLGPSYARSLVKELEINKVDVYRALRSLTTFGLIEVKVGNPSIFTAVNPRLAIEALLARQEDKVKALKVKSNGLIKRLMMIESKVTSKDEGKEGLFVKLLAGPQTFEKVGELILKAEKSVVKVVSPRGIVLHSQYGIQDIEAKRVEDGLEIRAITEVNVENVDVVRGYAEIIKIKHLDDISSRLRYIVVDDKHLILPVSSPPKARQDPIALWCNSSTLINSLLHDFEVSWYEAEDVSEKICSLSPPLVGE